MAYYTVEIDSDGQHYIKSGIDWTYIKKQHMAYRPLEEGFEYEMDFPIIHPQMSNNGIIYIKFHMGKIEQITIPKPLPKGCELIGMGTGLDEPELKIRHIILEMYPNSSVLLPYRPSKSDSIIVVRLRDPRMKLEYSALFQACKPRLTMISD